MSMRKFAALIPVCALFAACGGDATPEAKAPEGGAAAAEEAKPAEGAEAKPAEGAEAKPAEGGDAKPADPAAK